MLQAAAEVEPVDIPEAPASQDFLEVIIAIKQAKFSPCPCNKPNCETPLEEVHLVRLHQTVLAHNTS